MRKIEHVTHDSIPPVYDENSKILILGSMPSRKSRENKFYYMHPQNRFWKVLEALFHEKIKDKKEFLLRKKIALWDTIASCDITGSSDASIKNVVPNDVAELIKHSNVKTIFTAGKTAEKYYRKYIYPKIKTESIILPSSSPANAQKSLKQLVEDWKVILEYLEEEEEYDGT